MAVDPSSPSPRTPGAAGAGAGPGGRRRVALVTLGCARNEVDSEELAGRLAAEGWQLVADAAAADVAVVNTCGFITAAKKDSIDTLIEAAAHRDEGATAAVVAVGCLAERYGVELAQALPEADAVLGFDDYPQISARLQDVLAGTPHVAHTPRDRRALLPLAPVDRHPTTSQPAPPDGRPTRAPASGPRPLRHRLADGPVAPLKLASGCDRRCSFCAIPAFRGAYLSRPPPEVLAEARWLAEQGVREVVLVSENSTSYGKDLGDLRSLEALLPRLAALDGIDRVRVSYLQPAEMRPTLVEVLTGTPNVAPYFDLSVQHASPSVLRRMRRFGDTDRFLSLLQSIRAGAPAAGVRSNVILGFPGETEDDVAELERFLTHARLDAIGVFGYSDEDGTEAAGLEGKLPEQVVLERVERVTRLAEELTAQRAEDRVGELVDVLVESLPASATEAGAGAGEHAAEGRAAHQGPEVDGVTLLGGTGMALGQLVRARVVSSSGVDLMAAAVGPVARESPRSPAYPTPQGPP